MKNRLDIDTRPAVYPVGTCYNIPPFQVGKVLQAVVRLRLGTRQLGNLSRVVTAGLIWQSCPLACLQLEIRFGDEITWI